MQLSAERMRREQEELKGELEKLNKEKADLTKELLKRNLNENNESEKTKLENERKQQEAETSKLKYENISLQSMNAKLLQDLEYQKSKLQALELRQREQENKQRDAEEKQRLLELRQKDALLLVEAKNREIELANALALEKEKQLRRQREYERIREMEEEEELVRLKEIEKSKKIQNQNLGYITVQRPISAAITTGNQKVNLNTCAASAMMQGASSSFRKEVYVNRQVNSTIKGEIIKNMEELDMLTRKINRKNKTITYNLIYKASVDGDTAEVFHKICDEAKCSLVLVETTKGRRFGGFTTQSWEGETLDKIDNAAFVFSLDKMECYRVIKNEKAIGAYPKFGPVFFGCQIKILDSFFTNGGSTYKRGSVYKTTEDFILNGGEQKFKVKELEVYEVDLS